MRDSRHFRPRLDELPRRIAPSSAVHAIPAVVIAMDDTGSPGGEPSGEGCYPILFVPPGQPGSNPNPVV